MNDAGRISTIMHLLIKSYVPTRVEHIGIRILGRRYVMNMLYALCICILILICTMIYLMISPTSLSYSVDY